MDYHEAVAALYGLRRFRPDMGTETTASLLAHLGAPHEELVAVQIAGSNGKGSTASVLARILREAGLTVGLYTSPDLNDVRERIRVNGTKITKRAVCSFVDEAWPHVASEPVEEPTYFEAITAMALWYFERRDVDVAVLEVGIGGRYDATSVVSPAAAAITSVSLEHTDVLGSTVEEIARDKAHVAPDETPLVTAATGTALETIRAETEVVTVGYDENRDGGDDGGDRDAGNEDDRTDSIRSRRRDEPDVSAAETGMVSATESSVSLVGPDWEVSTQTPLLGSHQAVNVAVAATLARQVASPSEREIAAGIRNVHWPGRFEVMDDAPLVVLDGAHNPAACETVSNLLERFDYDDLLLVFGAMSEKDHTGMCRSLPEATDVFLAEPDIDRAEETDVLERVFEHETAATVTSSRSVRVALERALRAADERDCVLVAGSLYLVAEARPLWTQTPTPVRTGTRTRARTVMEGADVPAAERERAADRLVHRTVQVRTRPEVAAELSELLGTAGGTVVRSGLSETGKQIDVVLSGTIHQFDGLVEKLRGRAGETRQVVDRLNEVVRTDDGEEYPWGDGTAVMGILNVTPDSFFDGGEHDSVDAAVDRATEMIDAGADVVDVGGESTRPGADPVPTDVERERVLPVVERVSDMDALVSIDTRKPAVAADALDAGADVVNDVSGLGDAAMRRVVADREVPVVCMHSHAVPVDPDRENDYDDVVRDVLDELTERLVLAERAGIDRSRIIVDPGLGFGKGAAESFELLDRLEAFRALGTPIVVGHSRKSMFEAVTSEPAERLAPTVAATALAAERGVDIVRVHDVAANAAAVSTAERTSRAHER